MRSSLSLRVFSDANGVMWKNSVKDISGEVLCVSQFTLMANTTKGNKPDFHRAMVRGRVHMITRLYLTSFPSLPSLRDIFTPPS